MLLPVAAFALVGLALDHQHVAAPGFGQMIGNARPDDSASDNDYIRGLHVSSVRSARMEMSCGQRDNE